MTEGGGRNGLSALLRRYLESEEEPAPAGASLAALYALCLRLDAEFAQFDGLFAAVEAGAAVEAEAVEALARFIEPRVG